jgi:hypothetical protein
MYDLKVFTVTKSSKTLSVSQPRHVVEWRVSQRLEAQLCPRRQGTLKRCFNRHSTT